MTTVYIGKVSDKEAKELSTIGEVELTENIKEHIYCQLKLLDESFNNYSLGLIINREEKASSELVEEFAKGILDYVKDKNSKANLVRIITENKEHERIMSEVFEK